MLSLQGRDAIVEAVEASRRFGEAQLLTKAELARLCIIVEELLANLYDHGGVTEKDAVAFRLSRDAEAIVVLIDDPGTSFNPWSVRTAQANRGGGAGVRLIQAWAELISYHSSGQGNQLQLRLPLGRNGVD